MPRAPRDMSHYWDFIRAARAAGATLAQARQQYRDQQKGDADAFRGQGKLSPAEIARLENRPPPQPWNRALALNQARQQLMRERMGLPGSQERPTCKIVLTSKGARIGPTGCQVRNALLANEERGAYVQGFKKSGLEKTKHLVDEPTIDLFNEPDSPIPPPTPPRSLSSGSRAPSRVSSLASLPDPEGWAPPTPQRLPSRSSSMASSKSNPDWMQISEWRAPNGPPSVGYKAPGPALLRSLSSSSSSRPPSRSSSMASSKSDQDWMKFLAPSGPPSRSSSKASSKSDLAAPVQPDTYQYLPENPNHPINTTEKDLPPYFEGQQRSQCGMHAINNLLGKPIKLEYYIKVREQMKANAAAKGEPITQQLCNDDGGMASDDLIREVLKSLGYKMLMVMFNTPEELAALDPNRMYIFHQPGHWVCSRDGVTIDSFNEFTGWSTKSAFRNHGYYYRDNVPFKSLHKNAIYEVVELNAPNRPKKPRPAGKSANRGNPYGVGDGTLSDSGSPKKKKLSEAYIRAYSLDISNSMPVTDEQLNLVLAKLEMHRHGKPIELVRPPVVTFEQGLDAVQKSLAFNAKDSFLKIKSTIMWVEGGVAWRDSKDPPHANVIVVHHETNEVVVFEPYELATAAPKASLSEIRGSLAVQLAKKLATELNAKLSIIHGDQSQNDNPPIHRQECARFIRNWIRGEIKQARPVLSGALLSSLF